MSKPSLSPYSVAIGQPTVQNEYHFNLMGHIGEPENYTDLLNTLRSANSGDKVFIHINSPGGWVSTAVQIVNTMKNSEATVYGIVESEAASAATIIFLACDVWMVEDDTICMFHQYTGGGWNEGHKLKAQIAAMDNWISELNRKYYKDFLTDEELDDMMQGKDFWFTAEQMRERLERLVEIRTKAMEEMELERNKQTLEDAKKAIAHLENQQEE